ncbi:DUF4365 domain-containing protein [Vibrio parahaemolyticus]|uniref:DUF4365 domain-containing protein n=1 Tax=Vibrio parahaemolyticus TaxID=670 RepID=UPI0004716C79|nr:DUF4365 domain-containing protein [Vibrio parahaemolyticus]
MQRPIVHENIILETASEHFFKSVLPRGWTSDKPVPDIGVDLVVGIVEDNRASSRELLVQLKASNESNATADGLYERINLDVSTYNYLWDMLPVVLLVKYVASENTAYWQLLSQVPAPDQDNLTMTVKIPRNQVLNDESWNVIRRYVEAIHLRKLSMRERVDLSQFT